MFTTQMNYWTEMMEKVQDSYKESLKSSQTYQDAFSGFLRDMMESNYKTTMNFHKEATEVGKRMMDSTLDQMNHFSQFHMDTLQYSVKSMNSVMDKFSVKNDELRKEIEKVWSENSETFQRKMKELMEMVTDTQRKNTEEMFNMYRSFAEVGMKELHKKMETLGKTENGKKAAK